MPYVLLVVSALLFESALNLPIGSMPLALTAEGASPGATAAAMGAGMFAALLVSLPLGAVADRFGRLATIRAAGVGGLVVLGALGLVHGLLPAGALMALRSVALVAYMTAEFAYASALASEKRAVSGVATLGMIGNLTFATAPALAVFLWQHGIGRDQYLAALVPGAVGVACLFFLPARHDVRTASRRSIVLPAAWLPAMALALTATMQGGVNGSLAILTFRDRGIANAAAIFTASALASFLLRYPAGRLVDRFGPRAVAIPVVAIQAVGALLAARAGTLEAVVVAGIFLGTAWAAVVPVVIGLLFENSGPETRGAAMGGYNLAFSAGAACGALLAAAGALGGGGYAAAMSACAVMPALALPFVLRSRPPRPVAAPAGPVAARVAITAGATGD